jgi:hypothetical protein
LEKQNPAQSLRVTTKEGAGADKETNLTRPLEQRVESSTKKGVRILALVAQKGPEPLKGDFGPIKKLELR